MATQIDTPTFVKIEYFNFTNGSIGEWSVGHHGINLMNPVKYIAALSDNGTVARAIDKATGEVIATNEDDFDLSAFDPAVEVGPPEHEDDPEDDLPGGARANGWFPGVTPGTVEKITGDPTEMTPDQLRAALMAEGDFTAKDVKSYGPGFMIKALIALRTPAPEPEEEIDVLDEFADLADFDDDEEEVPVITSLPITRLDSTGNVKSRGEESVKFKQADDFDAVNPTFPVDAIPDDVPTAEEAGQALFIGMPGTKDYIFDGHAGAGPSGAERWMECTASLGAARAFLETLTVNQQVEFAKASMAARQGTTAHAIAESEARLLLGEITEDEHNNTILELTISPPDGEEYDDEMAEYLTEYNDLVKQFVQAGHEVHVEMRVSAAVELTTVTNGERDVHEIHGSADTVVMPLPRKRKKDQRVLSVIDLKYGKGKDVDPDENPQGMTYALGVIDLLAEQGEDVFDIDRVDIIIVQPRLGGIKTWSTTVDDLLEWRDEVLSGALTEALAGLKGGARFVPGEVQCQWCPARGGCAALAEQRMEAAVDLFTVITESEFEGEVFPETHTLTNDRLAVLYSQVTGLTKIADDLKAELQRRLHRGIPVPGYQLVNYTPRSSWKDGAEEKLDPELGEELAIDLEVADKLWQRKMLSPTQALKMLGKGNEGTKAYLESLIDRPDKRPVAAPEGDRRKTWEGRAPEAMFEDESTADALGMFEDES